MKAIIAMPGKSVHTRKAGEGEETNQPFKITATAVGYVVPEGRRSRVGKKSDLVLPSPRSRKVREQSEIQTRTRQADNLKAAQQEIEGLAKRLPSMLEYARVLAHAVDTFGSRMKAGAWLNRPNRVFSNRSPLQVLTQDPSGVEEELVRIDHGMVS